MKVVAIVQARMGSTRLPGKVMKDLGGTPLIGVLLARLARAERVNQIVVATSVDSGNLPLKAYVESLGYVCEQGSEKDVLQRYADIAKKHQADVVVRVTGDCPLVDPLLVDTMISGYLAAGTDYYSNVVPPCFPDGLDLEVFSAEALFRCIKSTDSDYDHEHVTPWIRESGQCSTAAYQAGFDLSHWRWTVDVPADLVVIRNVFNHFSPDIFFSWQAVRDLQSDQPELFDGNSGIKRNEGASMGTGQKLWKRAKQIIPGGNMLLSKRSEMFLPDLWPSYFSKAKGCTVWDMDGNEFLDMSIMGIGTNILGYGHPEVDDAVRHVIDTGNMATFNCPEEVWLAEKLIELNPWADMVRYARSGGEANAIAIRIARAASGKDNVAICGYHGWHDWYLSANLGSDESLAGHLLPGLDPKGVPANLRNTVYPFNYNRFDELQALVDNHNIGVIKMEVVRNMGPEDNFLQKVRQLATEKGIVLIFDECTSGFRQSFGGIYKLHDVEPDMAIYGKAMGNGYAITSVVGRREIMEAAQSTFISSTFWTERIGPAAALKTLEVMEREKSWETITNTGLNIRERWQALADKYELKINHWGLPALTGFTFDSEKALYYKTLTTQMMLEKGILASNSVYVCTEHTEQVVDRYFTELDDVFAVVRECEDGRVVEDLLKGPICHAGFKRLN